MRIDITTTLRAPVIVNYLSIVLISIVPRAIWAGVAPATTSGASAGGKQLHDTPWRYARIHAQVRTINSSSHQLFTWYLKVKRYFYGVRLLTKYCSVVTLWEKGLKRSSCKSDITTTLIPKYELLEYWMFSLSKLLNGIAYTKLNDNRSARPHFKYF